MDLPWTGCILMLVVIAKGSNGRSYIPRLSGRSLRAPWPNAFAQLQVGLHLGSFHHCCALGYGRQCTFPGAAALLLQQLED